MPASINARMTASLASPFSPFSVVAGFSKKTGASAVKNPSASTVKGMRVSSPSLLSFAVFAS